MRSRVTGIQLSSQYWVAQTRNWKQKSKGIEGDEGNEQLTGLKSFNFDSLFAR